VDLESRGIVGVGVATTEFVEAAQSQADALGYDPAMLFVQHPIQDRTDEEIRAIADSAFDSIVSLLTKAN
jgi:hypothetical protein